MSSADGICFTPWPHAELPGFSLPALEAAKCVAKQGDELFERVHRGLYEAFFTHSRNIADREAVAAIVAAAGADMERFAADVEAGVGREAVIGDYEGPGGGHGGRPVPTVIVADTGRGPGGLADYAVYPAAAGEGLA